MKNTFSDVFFPLLEFLKPTRSTIYGVTGLRLISYFLFQVYDLPFKKKIHTRHPYPLTIPMPHALPSPTPVHTLSPLIFFPGASYSSLDSGGPLESPDVNKYQCPGPNPDQLNQSLWGWVLDIISILKLSSILKLPICNHSKIHSIMSFIWQ